MNDQDETERTAALLRAALSAAADVMVVHDAPERQHVKHVKHARGRLLPLAAAAGIAVIALGGVIVAQLAIPTGTRPTGTQGATQTTAQASRPEFYMTATYSASGPNVLQFQVRRTNGGAVTASTSIPGANMGWGGHLTAAAGDRAFYFARYPCTTTVVPHTTFYRITITNSGRISSFTPVGTPVQGMVTSLAVSPDGSQMAYNALPDVCAGRRFMSTAEGSVSVTDLSTGTVRTWQDDTTGQNVVDGLSWAPDGRRLIVDENLRGSMGLTIFGLDTTSSGGSLQAHSTTLLRQNGNCFTCVVTALAGPDGSLTVLESKAAGRQTRMLVISIPSAAGSPRTVLYSELIDAPEGTSVDVTGLFLDPSGQWVLQWPTMGVLSLRHQDLVTAGWISGGRLHPLPGVAQLFPQGIAW
jgi:hypothetical protein